MSVSIDLNRLNRLTAADNVKKAEYYLGNQFISDAEPFVPFLHGDLSNSAHLEQSGGKTVVVYPQPYANAQWTGYINGRPIVNRTLVHHPQASDHWDRKAAALYTNQWEQLVKNALKGAK